MKLKLLEDIIVPLESAMIGWCTGCILHLIWMLVLKYFSKCVTFTNIPHGTLMFMGMKTWDLVLYSMIIGIIMMGISAIVFNFYPIKIMASYSFLFFCTSVSLIITYCYYYFGEIIFMSLSLRCF